MECNGKLHKGGDRTGIVHRNREIKKKGRTNSETEKAEPDPCSVVGGCHDVSDASDDGICG